MADTVRAKRKQMLLRVTLTAVTAIVLIVASTCRASIGCSKHTDGTYT